jgi:hypothetical protein
MYERRTVTHNELELGGSAEMAPIAQPPANHITCQDFRGSAQMSSLQHLSHPRPDDCRHQLACHLHKELEAAAGRYEPLALGAHRVSVDPYAAWLAGRAAAREREDSVHIRWVYRYRGTDATILNPKA